MRSGYSTQRLRLESALEAYERANGALPSLRNPLVREILVDQLIDSERRESYFLALASRGADPDSADPTSDHFNPVKAAVLARDAGDVNEALWLLFLFVHFGKHRQAGWRYARMVYSRSGQRGLWDWHAVSSDVAGFRDWLEVNEGDIRNAPRQGFGNHRKRESLNARSDKGTGHAVESYVRWVRSFGDHESMQDWALRSSGTLSGRFDALYKSMSSVARFGRLARFDYLTAAGRFDLLPISPGFTYLVGASGPRDGALLLFSGIGAATTARALEARLVPFATELGVSAAVLEDALCNWAKDPVKYVYFRG